MMTAQFTIISLLCVVLLMPCISRQTTTTVHAANDLSLRRGVGNNNNNNFEELKERVLHPTIPNDIRGMTLEQLGVDVENSSSSSHHHRPRRSLLLQPSERNNHGRMTQEQSSFSFFSIYDEFGPPFTTIGDTAGIRGTIYSNDARQTGLQEKYIEGALDATCSVVSSKGIQLCTYEIFLLNSSQSFLGTVVATGSVSMELNTENLLIIEATGDDLDIFHGGLLSLTYTAIGKQTIADIDIIF